MSYNAGNELECRMKTAEACSKSSTTEISGYKYDGAGNETKITEYSEAASTSFAFNNLSQLEGLTPPGKPKKNSNISAAVKASSQASAPPRSKTARWA